MEFGKVEADFLSRIDFKLPPDDERSRFLKSSTPARIGIGCPVWASKAWLGSVYPSKAESTELLYLYSRAFNSIELNTTHYRIPDLTTIARWREQTPEGFRFCPKFPQDISHKRPLYAHTALIEQFVGNVMALEDRLGLSFLQLSPAFAPMDLPDLRKFLRGLPKDFPIAVEVRHPAYFQNHRLADPLFDLLQEAGAAAVITDVAGRRDVLHVSLPTSKVLVRFIGNDLHATDDTRLAEWATRVSKWLQAGLTEIEFFVHQPGDTNGPEGVSRFTKLLIAAAKLNLSIWKPVEEISTDTQLSFF